MPEDIKFTDVRYDNLPNGCDQSKLKPQNHWDGPFVEAIYEMGDKVMVPAIEFKPDEYMQLWKRVPGGDPNYFEPI